MYHYEAKQIHIISIPLTDDPVELDSLLAAINHAKEIAAQHHIDLDNCESASMRVEDTRGSEHLVIRLTRDLDRATDIFHR